MRVVTAALVWLLLCANASAEELETETFLAKDGAGLGVIAGFGYQFSGVGAAVSYYQPLRLRGLMLVPHLGVGALVADLSLGRYGSTPSRDTRIPLGVTGGVSLTYG